MAINSFSDLKTSLANWLARSDLSAFYDDIITLGESRLNRDLRIRSIEEALSVASSAGTVPADFLELKHARVEIAGGLPLEMRESDWVYRSFPNRSGEGIPQYIAVDGNSFIFGPSPDSSYTINGIYYKKPAFLSNSNTTNEWTESAADALLFACLSESAAFLKGDTRIPIWENRYFQAMKGYRHSYRKQVRRETRVSYR